MNTTTPAPTFNRWAAEDFLRKACLTRAELASRVGITPSYVTELLKGDKRAPSRSVVRRLAEVLDCNPQSLLFEPAA